MNDQDLRDCFAMFSLNGLLTEAKGDWNDRAIADLAYSLADAMLEARKPQETFGLPAIKRKRTK